MQDILGQLIGFVGLYFVLGLLFLYLTAREIYHGPDGPDPAASRQEVLARLRFERGI